MSVLLFDPSAGAAGDMIMAALLDLGADLDVVRQAVESVGCKLEITREEKSHIMATRAKVISDRRYQSVSEAVSILQGSSLAGIALENALHALDTLAEAESRVHGVPKAEARFHEIGALDALADIAGCMRSSPKPGCGARALPARLRRRRLCPVGARPSSRPGACGPGDPEGSHDSLERRTRR